MSRTVPARRRANQRGVQAREQILAAAITLFAERGFSGTSLADLAAEAGVAKASLLYHFPDKDGLWKAAVDHLWAEVDEFFDAHWPRATPPSRQLLHDMLALFVAAGIRWPAYIRIPFIEGATPSWRSDWLVDRHFGQHVQVTDRILRGLQRRGDLPAGEPVFLQALLTSAVNTMIAQAAMWERAYGSSYCTPQRLEELVELTLDCMLGNKVDRSVK